MIESISAGPSGLGPEGHGANSGGRDVAVVFASRVGLLLLNLLVQGMLAHFLLPEGRGSYAVCLAFATSLGLLFTPGAEEGAQQFLMTRNAVSQAVSTAFVICLVGGALAIGLAIAAMQSDAAFFHKAHARSFYLALCFLPVLAFSMAVEHQLAGLRRFGRLAVFLPLRAAVNIVGVFVLVRQMGFGVDGAIIALAASYLLMIGLCLRDLRRHCGLAAAWPQRASLAFILGYGLKFHVARVRSGVGPQLGILVLGLMASSGQIGLFAVACTLMIGFALISNAVGNALLPRIAVREAVRSLRPDELQGAAAAEVAAAPSDAEGSASTPALVALCLRLVCAVTAGAMLALLLVAGPLVELLFSQAFLPAVPLLWLIAPGVLANAGCGLLVTYFKAVNRPAICSRALWAGWCVELAVLVLLFPTMGVAAAALGVALGAGCSLVLLAIAFQRATALGWLGTWLPRRADATYLRSALRRVLERGHRG